MDVQEPNDIDFENFLDVADKTEEIQRELNSGYQGQAE